MMSLVRKRNREDVINCNTRHQLNKSVEPFNLIIYISGVFMLINSDWKVNL